VEIKKKYIRNKQNSIEYNNDNKKICYEKYERERAKERREKKIFFHSKQTTMYMSIV
jgi:hypothetical protein